MARDPPHTHGEQFSTVAEEVIPLTEATAADRAAEVAMGAAMAA